MAEITHAKFSVEMSPAEFRLVKFALSDCLTDYDISEDSDREVAWALFHAMEEFDV